MMNGHEDTDREDSIGRFVRKRRLAAGLTQRELADLAAVGTRFIVELEADKETLRLDKVNQVLRQFGKKLGVTGGGGPAWPETT